MDRVPLLSRLRAMCANADIPWAEGDEPEVLAHRMWEADVWPAFARKYDMRYDPDTRRLTDLAEEAYENRED